MSSRHAAATWLHVAKNLCCFETFLLCRVPKWKETPGRSPPCDASTFRPSYIPSHRITFQPGCECPPVSHDALGVAEPLTSRGSLKVLQELPLPPSPSGLPSVSNWSHHQREEARADIMQKTGVTMPERQIPDGARVSGGSVRVAGCVSGRTQGSLGTPLSVQNSVFLNAHHHCVPSTLAHWSGGGCGCGRGRRRCRGLSVLKHAFYYH